MSTVNAVYRFRYGEGTLGWSITKDGTYGAYLDGRWWGKEQARNPSRRPNSDVSDFWGVIALSQRAGGGISNSYWELTDTWENLGVPVGATVTAVKVAYAYRWQAPFVLKPSFDPDTGDVIFIPKVRCSFITFSEGDAKSGPFEVRKSDGTLIGTTSTAVNSIARTPFPYWPNFPTGGDVVSDIQSQWNKAYAEVTGTNVSITGAQQASNTTMKFRLNIKMPSTVGHFFWIRNKIKDIIITTTYTPPAISSILITD